MLLSRRGAGALEIGAARRLQHPAGHLRRRLFPVCFTDLKVRSGARPKCGRTSAPAD